jgi:hypothetical protein
MEALVGPDMSQYSWTHENFEDMSWHDNHVHSFGVVEGSLGGTLILDLDYIVEWLKNGDAFQFKIIPSILSFFEVAGLHIQLDYHRPDAALGPFSMDRIIRTSEKRERYTATLWQIPFNWPDGHISFEASGFSQVGRGAPVLTNRQRLLASERAGAG